jgi:hypothetical protein
MTNVMDVLIHSIKLLTQSVSPVFPAECYKFRFGRKEKK